MRLEQLNAFVETAKHNSMSIAAEKLYVTPQNISKSIAQLEQELGVKLFTRTYQGVVLTPIGSEAYIIANEILSRVDYLATELQNKQKENTIKGVLSISTSLSLSLFLTTTIADFTNNYPNISIQIAEHSHMSEWYEKHDFIFLSLYEDEIQQYTSPEIQKKYHLYFLRKEYFRLFVNKRSTLAEKSTISAKTLSATPLVVYTPKQNNNYLAEKLLRYLVTSPGKLFKTNNYNFCFQQIVIGNYAALSTNLLYNFCPQSFLSEITSVPLNKKVGLYHYMLVPKKNESTASDLFFKKINTYFQKDFKQIF